MGAARVIAVDRYPHCLELAIYLGAQAINYEKVKALVEMTGDIGPDACINAVCDKAAASSEGALVWVLSFVAILWLASAGVRLVASGISGVFGGVTRTLSSATGGMQNLSSGTVDQIVARLRDPQTARTMASATGGSEQQITARLNDIAGRVEAARDTRNKPPRKSGGALKNSSMAPGRSYLLSQSECKKVRPKQLGVPLQPC